MGEYREDGPGRAVGTVECGAPQMHKLGGVAKTVSQENIMAATDCLHNSIEYLDKQLTLLRDKLDPVILPPVPMSSKDNGAVPMPPEPQQSLARQQIAQAERRIHDLTQRVDAMIAGLDL